MVVKAEAAGAFSLSLLIAMTTWTAGSQAGPTLDDWSFAVGPGVAAQPEYVGSDKYQAWPLPIIEAKWKDKVFLSAQDGLGWNAIKTSNFRFGPLAHYYWGSRDRPSGINNIDFGTQVGAFAEFAFSHWKLDATALYAVSGSSEGARANLGLAYGTRINKNWEVVVRADADYFNDNEMKTYFGINAREASDSNLREYSPSMGIADAGLGLKINYQISEDWSMLGLIRGSTLLGDAKDSPLTQQEFQGYGGVGFAYHF
ncbi:MAG: hypothetical protein A3G18_02800 [Rhodospirillales bacterium RIFCSPLOWO2_12_FULL_58_28]|nr:MAG: hypothetical protein A3H92_00765 [Rhodospirillales bacterium RIFCSPLOWO2_02_FULL_58_16]OHC77077.1 MAG: hypothetical protein A3G18_02800 [Rhodospirillales bacterium RIFCSPLOWO2_12_FULL_58_28]